MTFRSTFAALALLGLVALSPFVSPARGAGERYVVNYRAGAASPWLEYTTTRGLTQARSAVAELEALGYQAEYVTEPVGPVYSGGTYYYAPGYTYYHAGGGGSYYNHYQYNHHTAHRYHYHHAHHHHYGHHHRSGAHHYGYHHHDAHHHVAHHHTRHHHTGHHSSHHRR
jgi:hypothetical protein